MRNLRALNFWIAVLLAGGLWLVMLYLGSGKTAPMQDLFRSVHLGRGNPLIDATRIFSRFGGWVILMTVAVAAGAFLVWRRRPQRAAVLLLMVFSGRLLVEMQKLLFDHPRPDATEHLVRVSSMSFPSAHAANSMITYLGIALLLPMPPRVRWLAAVAAIVASGAIGVSRIALGVHWPVDVLGGWGFGLMWVLLWLRLSQARPEGEAGMPRGERRNRRSPSFILRVKEKGDGKSKNLGRARSRRFRSDRRDERSPEP